MNPEDFQKAYAEQYKKLPQEKFDRAVIMMFQRVIKHFARKKRELLAVSDADYKPMNFMGTPMEGQLLCSMYEKRGVENPLEGLAKLLNAYNSATKVGRKEALQAIEDGKVVLRQRMTALYGKDATDKVYRGKYGIRET